MVGLVTISWVREKLFDFGPFLNEILHVYIMNFTYSEMKDDEKWKIHFVQQILKQQFK